MRLSKLAIAAGLIACMVSPAAAQTAEPFAGKTIEIYTGYSVGGGYDLYARMVARHLAKHIPGNPAVVPKNMEGAASMRLANWLANAAPKDGTVFGTIGRGTAFDPLLGQPGAQYDGTRFSWIGSANDEVSICAAWHTAGVSRFEDLMTKELTVGGTGPGDDTVQFAKVLVGVLGAKLRIVSGYPGGNDVVLAMERGELQGRCGWSWSSVKATHGAWITDKKIKVLVQLALTKHPDLLDVPLIADLARTDEQRQILKLIFARQVMGRPFLGPPGIPPERLAILRKAFMETMSDKDFLADAERSKMEITPVPGEKIAALVREIYKTSPEVARKAGEILK